MNYPDLIDVDNVYSCADAVHCVMKENVYHPVLKDICKTYTNLRKELGPDLMEPFWKSSLRPLGKYIINHLMMPLPLSNNESINLVNQFNDLTNNPELTVPSYANQINDLKDSLSRLTCDSSNPLYEKFEEIVKRENSEDKIGLVVPPSYIRQMTAFFNNQLFINYQNSSKFVIVSPKDLKKLNCYKTLIVFGWTKIWKRQGLQYIFDAPRADQIFLITYEWLSNDLSRANSFLKSQNGMDDSQLTLITAERETSDHKATIPSDIAAFDAILPVFSLNELRDRIGKDNIHEDFDNDDTAMANLVELEDSKGVFLNRYSLTNPEKLTKHYIISLSDSDNPMLKRQYFDDMELEDFLVLRTEGGGVDYITPIADLIMGGDAEKCRATQKEWKRILKEMVNVRGIHNVVKGLEDIDCSTANVANIRNWINPRTIMLQSESDFEILISFLNLSEKFDEILMASKLIRTTHTRVGRLVGDKLRSQIKKITREELFSPTVTKFTLDEYGSGSMTAYQIINIGTEETEMHVSQIGKILEVE